MKKWMASLLALSILAGLTMTGCGEKKEAGNESSSQQKHIESICYVTANLGDKSMSDIANEGLVKAGKEFGLTYKTIEYGTDKAKIEPSILDAAENYDLVFLSGSERLEYVQKHAAEFPDVKFVAFDVDPSKVPEHPNVYCITYAQNEGDFLAAALAQKMSKNGVIGWVGGREDTVINDFLVGYIEGSKHANPSGKVAISFVGDFSNAPKAKELALLQIEQSGANIIHQVAGGAGLGVFEALSTKEGTWGIGVDADQRNFFIESKPEIADLILVSMQKRNDVAIYDLTKMTMNGETEMYGTNETWGIARGAIGLSENDFYRQNTPKEVQDYIAQCKEGITGGSVKVKSAFGMEQDVINTMKNEVKA